MKDIEWDYSRNQRRHSAIIRVNGQEAEVHIKANNMNNVFNYQKDGYSLYFADYYDHVKEIFQESVFIKQAKTVKELKKFAGEMV